MFTKKRLAILTIFITFVYYIPIFYLPESIVGTRAEQMLLYAPKVFFLSLTASITTAFVLIFIFRRDFILLQLYSFNRYKYLLHQMIKRDFVTRYRKSVLGVLWSLLNPLLTMIVMTIVFSQLFRFEIENFPVYLLSGFIIFWFFSESTTLAMNSIIANEGIIKKVYVPKYIFPLSKVLSSLINLAFSFLAFLFVFIVTGASFHWTMLMIPLPLFYVFVFSLGVAMFLSSMTVFFRDLTYLYGILITLLMYMTPLFYPVEILPYWMIPVIGFNPIYHFVDYFRALALHGIVPDLWANMVCIGFTLAALCGGAYIFIRQQDKYILYM